MNTLPNGKPFSEDFYNKHARKMKLLWGSTYVMAIIYLVFVTMIIMGGFISVFTSR